MAGPCCGVTGNLDVLEGNLVPIRRKKKREQFTSIANNPKLTVEDHVVGGFKSDKTSATLLYLQPLRSDKSAGRKVVEASPSSGYLPLSNPASQQRSLTAKKSSLEGSPNREVLVHSYDANKEPSSGSIKHCDNSKEEQAHPNTNDVVLKTFQDVAMQSTKVGPPEETINGSRMLINCSGVIGGSSYNSDGPAAQRSFPQPKEISIPQAVNSYPRQAFLVPDRGRHLRRKENDRIGDMHTNLPISDSCMGKEISHPCVSNKRINNMPYGHKQNNCLEDNEVNEHEIDGDSCLSSFTFSSTSSSFSSQEDKSSRMPLHSNGKMPHSKSPSSESTISTLLLDDTKDMSFQNGLSTATYTVLTRRNFLQSALSKETEQSYNGQVPVDVATYNKKKNCQADKVDAGGLLFLKQEPIFVDWLLVFQGLTRIHELR